MNKDMLDSIDDSALEAVSGGHDGLLAHAVEHAKHVREHIVDAIDHVGDVAGGALKLAGSTLTRIGEALKD